jgi:hypothetical protein
MTLRVIEGGMQSPSKVKAAEVIGYAVESELEEGFLVHASPSVWHFDLASAVLYETPNQAWASAKRRSSALAKAVEVVREPDGSLSWKPAADPAKATEGDWVVWFELIPGGDRMYVVKNGKRVIASKHLADAKGYKTKLAAEMAVPKFATEKAGVEQLKADLRYQQ